MRTTRYVALSPLFCPTLLGLSPSLVHDYTNIALLCPSSSLSLYTIYTYPGQFGDSGSSFNSQWPASSGELWQGGHGSEFGAGGGGGYQGGGGGGTTPGIGGGGGGGASYVYDGIAKDITIVPGYGRIPGGLEHDPPEACGYGEWDKVGGIVGEGGEASTTETKNGNAGAVRIIKPGFY